MQVSARHFHLVFPLLAAVILAWPSQARADEAAAEVAALRRPIALDFFRGRLLCANRDSGSVSLIELNPARVSSEQKIGRRLEDLESTGAGVLVTDSAAGLLLYLSLNSDRLELAASVAIDGSPGDIALAGDRESCAVASPWSRKVTLVHLENGNSGKLAARLAATVRLPFSPGLLVFCREDTLLVAADAFGGQLALIDPKRSRLLGVRRVEAHGIRGLAASRDGESIHLSHQRIESGAPTTRNRVFWGQVISNILRSVSLKHLLEEGPGGFAQGKPIAHWSLYPFGTPGKAAGDPGAVAIGSHGATLVALGGVDRVALRSGPGNVFEEIDVGDRPVALALGPGEDYGYVANHFDDSISIVDIAGAEVVGTISLGPGRKLTPAEKGEKLFYDAKLSLDGWYSCHSCHLDGHTHGQLNDNLGDDTYGTPKRVPTLLGTSNTGPWGWIGNRTTLWEQVEKSVETTMRGKKPEAPVVEALVAYLELFDKPAPASTEQDQAAVKRGSVIFRRLNCGKCHRPPAYTTVGSYDVGLSDEAGQSSYNPPSLRGLRHRARFLHDNRTRSISGALELHRPESMKNLSGMDRSDLLSFLLSL